LSTHFLAASICGEDQQGTLRKTSAKAAIMQNSNLFLFIAVAPFKSIQLIAHTLPHPVEGNRQGNPGAQFIQPQPLVVVTTPFHFAFSFSIPKPSQR
jgi:hypothetical protein